jgi:hypothetical protein
MPLFKINLFLSNFNKKNKKMFLLSLIKNLMATKD